MNTISRLPLKQNTNPIHQSLFIFMALGIMLFFTAVCVGQTETQPVGGYETPGVLDAYKILPPDLLEGEDFWVDRNVVSFGFNNRYTIVSRFGQFEADGDEMLRIRVHEISAIDAVEEIKKTKAFGEAVKKAVKSPIKGAKALITNPVATVKGVPKGVGRFFGRIGEMVKGGRGDQEEGYTKELIGFSAVKRQYAHKLGVDVYSSNEMLQKELNSVSWAGFAGGLTVTVAMMGIKGASNTAFYAVKGTQLIHGMNMILLDSSPEDLRKLNRKKLKQIGVEDSVIEEFIKHPKYSPRHTTILVQALAEMEGVKSRDQFIKQALFAEYEEEALLYQLMAEMMHGYHTNVRPLSEIIPVRRIVMGYTVDKDLIATIPADYVYWTERADLGSAAVVRLKTEGSRPVKNVELWFTGKLTPRARQECNARGLVIKEGISDILMPPSAQ